MRKKAIRDDPFLKFVGIFLPAGVSALLLSIAHFQPILWFISLFALVPYLWKLKRTDITGSVILGVILATCFAFVVLIDDLPAAPIQFLLKLIILVLIFSFFGIIINRTKEHIGFYPVFIAALWIPLEYFLIRYADIDGILKFPVNDLGMLVRFGSLVGLLMISFTVMLINSVIVLLFEYAGRTRIANFYLRIPDRATSLSLFVNIGSTKRWYCLPNLRAPPVKF